MLWQPIETAPKDEFLLFYDKGSIVTAIIEGSIPFPRTGNIVLKHASHWMKLPEPPSDVRN